ncbi:hypothetical protein ACVWYH_002297 [Bradyrhizobium sp. GM24.11]
MQAKTEKIKTRPRGLCERTICPNLRPQTGPDGGGDSKADTETYPVSDEVSGLTYIGDANSGRERWAFAFSAKKEWSVKVRADVKGIAETGRGYDKIIFVTSRFAKAKDRARIEDELSKQYSIRVTILDRSWIVTEIIEKKTHRPCVQLPEGRRRRRRSAAWPKGLLSLPAAR